MRTQAPARIRPSRSRLHRPRTPRPRSSRRDTKSSGFCDLGGAYTQTAHSMKDFYIGDCPRHENKVITSSFVVVIKQIKPKKTGEPYLALTLGDRTGQIEAKMWDNVEEVLDAFEQDDFIKVKGLLNKYKNRFQLTVHKLRKLGESEIDF